MEGDSDTGEEGGGQEGTYERGGGQEGTYERGARGHRHKLRKPCQLCPNKKTTEVEATRYGKGGASVRQDGKAGDGGQRTHLCGRQGGQYKVAGGGWVRHGP